MRDFQGEMKKLQHSMSAEVFALDLMFKKSDGESTDN